MNNKDNTIKNGDIDQEELLSTIQKYLLINYKNDNITTFWELTQFYEDINDLISYYSDLYFGDYPEIDKLAIKITKSVISAISSQSYKSSKKYENSAVPDFRFPVLENIDELCLQLLELNRQIKDGNVDLTKERDCLVENILYHDGYAKALLNKAIETKNYYRSINSNFSYDVDILELQYREMAVKKLKNILIDFTPHSPRKFVAAWLFKKRVYGEAKMDALDLDFRDWTEKQNTYLLYENLATNDEEVYLEQSMIEDDSYNDGEVEIKEKNKVIYYYKKYDIEHLYDELLYSDDLEEWVIYLRGLILNFLRNKQRTIIEYYYYKNYTFEQIGKIMDIDKSNVSRNHRNAIGVLQDKIFNSDFYKNYPDLRRVFSISVGDYIFGLKWLYDHDPYSPLMIRILRAKSNENKKVI